MILNHLRTFFASFTIKLFLWFWFIALVAIMSTRFISQQLLNDNMGKVVIQTSDPEDIKQLSFFEKKLKRRSPQNITVYLKNMKQFRRGENIWVKNKDSHTEGTFKLPQQQKDILIEYINQDKTTKLQTALIARTRLTGPLSITFKQKNYQVYLSHREPKENLSHLVQQFPLWLRLAITIVISFFLCLLLARSLSKPILAIKKATSALAKGDLSTRVMSIDSRKDELGDLAHSFNKMAEKLEYNVNAQQRLLGDVSHELRSPLTRLRMALALIDENKSDETVRQKYLERCQLEVSRLDEMLGEVLVLSRLENTTQKLQLEQFDSKLLFNNIIRDAQFIADEKNIIIESALSSEIKMWADSALLTSAIGNILTNAIKYSPPNTVISVHSKSYISQDNKYLTLTISDKGPGVPELAIAQLFTAFYRVNSARDRQTGGTGLGLAIAKQAIIAHNGTISAKNNTHESRTDVNCGLTITIELPLK